MPAAQLRSRVVFAPAGSGKTEQLSERYIELLKAGVLPERILTLTFTEKAAAEMKERILRRLAERDPALYSTVRANILKLRISTIHAFCFSLLKRFADLLGLDPRLDVLADPAGVWLAAKYDTLMGLAEGRGLPERDLLLELVTREHTQGWERLSRMFDGFFGRRTAMLRARLADIDLDGVNGLAARLRADPLTRQKLPDSRALFPADLGSADVEAVAAALETCRDVYLTKSGTPLRRGCGDEERAWNQRVADYRSGVRTGAWYAELRRQFDLFRGRFLSAYEQAKREQAQVDYDDMEYLALRLLSENPEWQSILYAFDEHTDHLLVDEFQDTSFLQWGIVNKLTEEWQAGEGAKADKGITPTIFLVGDEKQSIYMFREAKVEVFAQAAGQLETWLGPDRLERSRLEDNYRSLQAVIDFNNALFSRLMSPAGQTGPTSRTAQPAAWRTRYAPFRRGRRNDAPGTVEVILDRFEGHAAENRQRDAVSVCRRINGLVADGFQVWERQSDGTESSRPCRFGDIAILIRQRTHLPTIEAELRKAGIPFVVVGGTGFYQEDEVRFLTALTSFLADPCDDVSLYATLRGPLFGLDERDLFLANAGDGLFLWDRVRAGAGPGTGMAGAVAALSGWLACVHREPLSSILDRALRERAAWRTFWEPQREANVRKFINIIQARELDGEHPLSIQSFLESAGDDEAKADVRAAGQNMVQVITVHSAKGLQFPIVFHPGLDERIRSASGSGDALVVEERSPSEVVISYIPDAATRGANPLHQEYREKQYEEEKRVFYVACTRARDGLFLSGVWNPKAIPNTRLAWLCEHLGLIEDGDGFRLGVDINGVSCLAAGALLVPPAQPVVRERPEPRLRLGPLRPAPRPRVRPVTRNTPQDFHRHTEEHIGVGEVIHRLLQQLSAGRLMPEAAALAAETGRLLRIAGLPGESRADLAGHIIESILGLRSSPVWEIIRPRPDAQAELPVMYTDGKTIYSGRIDRVIVTDDGVEVYDYKTFPVRKTDVPLLKKEYHAGQLIHYGRACRELYPGKRVTTYLVFTAVPLVVRTGTLRPA
jgi:ATP-dependent helicase/nuclease subunit A